MTFSLQSEHEWDVCVCVCVCALARALDARLACLHVLRLVVVKGQAHIEGAEGKCHSVLIHPSLAFLLACQAACVAWPWRWQLHKEVHVMRETVQHIRQHLPRSFVLENVEGIGDIPQSESASALSVIISDLEGSGYEVMARPIDMASFVQASRPRTRLLLCCARIVALHEESPQ